MEVKMQITTIMPVILFTIFTAAGMLSGCLGAESGVEQATDVSTSDIPTQETTAISSDPDATRNGGSVELPASKTFDVIPATVKNVGGGTWNYGRSGNHCWSHYVHPAKRHSATAIKGSTNRKVYAGAGTWANSDIYGGSGTCYAYWSTY